MILSLDASSEDIAKFNSTIEATEVLSEQIDSFPLRSLLMVTSISLIMNSRIYWAR